MTLDFNSKKLTFKEEDVGRYDVDVIYENIDKFKKFAQKYTINKTFDLIFEHEIFQTELLSEKCYLDNLIVMYNALAQPSIIGENVPQITTQEMKHQLRMRGYILKHTHQTISTGKYIQAYRVIKDLTYDYIRE